MNDTPSSGGPIRNPVGGSLNTANDDAHKHADTDLSQKAIHHTIGKGPNQAASGKALEDLVSRVAALEAAKLETQSWSDTGSGTTTPTSTTVVDVAGCSVTVPVEATTDQFLVIIFLSAFNNNTDSVNCFGQARIDNVGAGPSVQLRESDAGVIVNTASASFVTTGLTVGDRVFELGVSLSGAGSWDVVNSRSGITVVKING